MVTWLISTPILRLSILVNALAALQTAAGISMFAASGKSTRGVQFSSNSIQTTEQVFGEGKKGVRIFLHAAPVFASE